MMRETGVYIAWQCLRKGKVSGQVATLITLAIAIIFLFVAVTLNISKVSQRKTVVSNAADGGAIQLASSVGSYANMLSQKYLDGKTSKPTSRWGTFFMILAAIVAAIIGFIVGGPVGAAFGVGAVISAVGAGLNEFVFEPRIASGIQSQISRLPIGMQMSEGAIFYALRHSVDDAELVLDYWDDDRDGRTEEDGDHIRRFEQWYARRVDLLRNLVDLVREETPAFMDKIEDFAYEADHLRRDFTEDATRPIVVTAGLPNPEEEEEELQLLTAGEMGIDDGDFIILLEALSREADLSGRDELRVSFWVEDVDPENEDTYDEVDELSAHLHLFSIWVLGGPNGDGGLCGQHLDNAVLMSDMWMSQLYDPEDELMGLGLEGELWYDVWREANVGVDPGAVGRSWYDVWAEQMGRIENWRGELHRINTTLLDMLEHEINPLSIFRLRNLQQDVASADQTLDVFHNRLEEFNAEIIAFREKNQYEGRDTLTGLATQIGPRLATLFFPEFGAPNFAEYSWRDSLGWHHVRVFTLPFKVPHISVDQSFMEMSLVLKDYEGAVTITASRYDQSTATSFANQESTPLWKFRYARAEENFDPANRDAALLHGAISSSAVADYSYDRLPSLLFAR